MCILLGEVTERGCLFFLRCIMLQTNPDLDDFCFHSNLGEFSEEAEEKFEKHLIRLRRSAIRHRNQNGQRIPLIINDESPWFSLNDS